MDKDELRRVKYVTKTKRSMDANENKARAKANSKALDRMKEVRDRISKTKSY